MVATTLLQENLLDLLSRGKERSATYRRAVLVSLVQPLHSEASPFDVFLNSLARETTGTFWGKPEHNFWMAGSGRAVTLTAGNGHRFDEIKAQQGRLLDSAIAEGPSVRGTGPVFTGGFRFDTGTKRDTIWHSFPDALLILPRLSFTSSSLGTWLTLNILVEPSADIEALAAELLGELQAVIHPAIHENYQPAIKNVMQSAKKDWHRNMREALRAIAAGKLTKVVLSRRKVLQAHGNFSLAHTLRQLCAQYPECTVFAIRNGDTAFIGASPEGLAGIDAGRLSVTCLASSTARGNNPEDDRRLETLLFENQKERAEHNAVTAMVAPVLEELCRDLSGDTAPRPMKLKNIQHMLTCFTGSLKPGISILDVVKNLHPTPAVAGVPTGQALHLINRLEGDRGWYAAPVGWFDRHGEGEFAVAIRSALINQNTAVLYAGCGVVAGSNPEQEYAETELKFAPLLHALGYR